MTPHLAVERPESMFGSILLELRLALADRGDEARKTCGRPTQVLFLSLPFGQADKTGTISKSPCVLEQMEAITKGGEDAGCSQKSCEAPCSSWSSWRAVTEWPYTSGFGPTHLNTPHIRQRVETSGQQLQSLLYRVAFPEIPASGAIRSTISS